MTTKWVLLGDKTFILIFKSRSIAIIMWARDQTQLDSQAGATDLGAALSRRRRRLQVNTCTHSAGRALE